MNDRPDRLRRDSRTRRLILTAACVLGVAGCGGDVRPASGSPSAPPSQADWGPLAVTRTESGAAALAVGTLRVTETCVFLEDGGGDQSLLVWPEQRTSWRPETTSIEFLTRDQQKVELRDGDAVSVTGAGDSSSEGGLPGDEWMSSIDWVSAPRADCPLDSRVLVGDVTAS